MTTALEYRQAMLNVRDRAETSNATWEIWVRLLKAQYSMPGHAATAAQLATAAGLKTTTLAVLNYRKLAHAIADQLGVRPPEAPHGKKEPMWWMTLSSGSHDDDRTDSAVFTMHPGLAEALDLMRWVPSPAPTA